MTCSVHKPSQLLTSLPVQCLAQNGSLVEKHRVTVNVNNAVLCVGGGASRVLRGPAVGAVQGADVRRHLLAVGGRVAALHARVASFGVFPQDAPAARHACSTHNTRH